MKPAGIAVNVLPAFRRHAATALLAAIALAVGVARADAATLSSAVFEAPALTTQWMMESNDCAGSVSISNRRAVDANGFFSGWHVAWEGGGCLATSNTMVFHRERGAYEVLGERLSADTYYVQLQYCHDSDVSGGWFCRGTNARKVDIPAVGLAGTLSDVAGRVLVDGEPAGESGEVHYGEELRTTSTASAAVDLSAGGTLEVTSNTVLVPEGPDWAKVLSGRITGHFDRVYEVSSPTARVTMAETGAVPVTGTVFSVMATQHATRERTHRGSMAFRNETGMQKRTVIVNQGRESIVRGSNPPTWPRPF